MPNSYNSRNKIKRLPTQVFVGAYQGETAASEVERMITDEEWDAQSLICTNMVVCSKDIAGKTKIRELGNPLAIEAAASKAILGGLIGGMSQLMMGSNRQSVRNLAYDPSFEEDEKALIASKRPSIIAKVAERNITKMSETQLSKIGSGLIKGTSAIICVFDEVLVKQSDYDNHMKDHELQLMDLTDHITTKIYEHLRKGKDLSFHVVYDSDSGDVSWTRTVVGDGATQVRDIVMSHDSLALEEVTTYIDEDGEEKKVLTESVIVTPESVASARTFLQNSVCEFEVSQEDLIDDEKEGITAGDKKTETRVLRNLPDGSQSVMYKLGTVKGKETTYESKHEVTDIMGNTTAIDCGKGSSGQRKENLDCQ